MNDSNLRVSAALVGAGTGEVLRLRMPRGNPTGGEPSNIPSVIFSETPLPMLATNGWQAVCLNEDDEEPEIALGPLRRREPTVFEGLVRRHEPVVLGLCQSMGLAGPDLDDAAAEVFANVFRALPNFEGRSTLGTWVYRIACRTIPKVRAGVRKNRGAELPAEPVDCNQPTPLDRSESAELYQRLWDAVANLDDRESMAIELLYRRGQSVHQIAGALGCPLGTVKTLLFRGRQKLRRRLASQEVQRQIPTSLRSRKR